MVDADPDALRSSAASQPHDPAFVPFVRRAQAAGIPVEVVSDGFGFFIEPALEALGVGELPVVTARTDVRGPARLDRVPERPPDVPRVRDVQAAACARPPGRRPSRRVHRRRRERPVRRRLSGHRVREAVAGADLPRGRLGIPSVDGVQRDRRVASGEAGGVGRRPVVARRCAVRCAACREGIFCGPEVWGEGLEDPPPGSWPPVEHPQVPSDG